MERLTPRDWKTQYQIGVCARDVSAGECSVYNDCFDYIQRLAELEDMIDGGQLIKLPAPLGSELWHIEMPSYKDSNGKKWTMCTYKGAKVKKLKDKLSLSNLHMVIDGYYFLSKEEAENKLQKDK